LALVTHHSRVVAAARLLVVVVAAAVVDAEHVLEECAIQAQAAPEHI